MIRHSRPSINEADLSAIQRVLESGDVSSGQEILELEERFRNLTGKKAAISFNSWTSGAHALLSLLANSHPCGKVIIPSFSFAATANVVKTSGLTPVFADVNPVDASLNYESVISKIDEDVVAIMTVHYAGIFGVHTQALQQMCKQRGIYFIEDCAESLGALNEDEALAGSLGIGIYKPGWIHWRHDSVKVYSRWQWMLW